MFRRSRNTARKRPRLGPTERHRGPHLAHDYHGHANHIASRDASPYGDIWFAEFDDADDALDGAIPRLRKQNRARRDQARVQRPDRSHGPRERPAVRRQRPGRPEEFRCRHCRTLVGPVPSGGRHRNHCPVCLHSRHVDDRLPGDRMSACGGTMVPIGAYVRPGGEYGLVHRCQECDTVRHNRIAADDDFSLVSRLPDLTSRALSAAESGRMASILHKTTA
jgi:hypothetical protein